MRQFYFITMTYFLMVKHFKRQYLETARVNIIMHWATFIDFDIFQQMTPLRKLYSTTLTYFLM